MYLRSKVSRDGRIALPRAVREKLDIRPGDYLHYILEARSIRLLRARTQEANDPFATFFEWASKEDEEAYADL